METITIELAKWVVLTIFGVAGWVVKMMVNNAQDEIKTLKQSVEQLQRDKLGKDDFKEFKLELREMFNEIKIDIKELKGHDRT